MSGDYPQITRAERRKMEEVLKTSEAVNLVEFSETRVYDLHLRDIIAVVTDPCYEHYNPSWEILLGDRNNKRQTRSKMRALEENKSRCCLHPVGS